MDRLDQVALLIQIEASGSLAAASAALQISISAAYRQVRALEALLGTALVEGRGRHLTLTPAGRQLCEGGRRSLAAIADVEDAILELSERAKGTLCISATHSFATRHIAPLLKEYARSCPDVVVKIMASNLYPNLIDHDIDVAIRTTDFERDSSLTVRRLAGTNRILAATPDYLRRAGRPRSIEDLAEHFFLVYAYSTSPAKLRLYRNGVAETAVLKRLFKANDSQVLRAAALEHVGIVVQPTYILFDDLAAGRLVPVLEEWTQSPLTVNLAFPSRKYRSKKVRVFVDCITRHFQTRQFDRIWTAPCGSLKSGNNG